MITGRIHRFMNTWQSGGVFYLLHGDTAKDAVDCVRAEGAYGHIGQVIALREGEEDAAKVQTLELGLDLQTVEFLAVHGELLIFHLYIGTADVGVGGFDGINISFQNILDIQILDLVCVELLHGHIDVAAVGHILGDHIVDKGGLFSAAQSLLRPDSFR